MSVTFVIGSKGQVIKTSPVLREFVRRGENFNLIVVGLHGSRIADLLQRFGVPSPDVFRRRADDVRSIREGVLWLVREAAAIIASRTRFKNERIVCLQGDAPPSLVGLAYAIRRLKPVAHIEAGERTHRLLSPVPEEPTRRLIDRFSRVHFASSMDAPAVANLQREGYRDSIFDLGCNTLLDSVRYAISKPEPRSEAPGAIFSIHRLRTLSSRSRMTSITQMVEAAARVTPVSFPLHEPTRSSLRAFGLLSRLEANPRVTLMPLLPYFQFMQSLKAADFIVTDGGGLQQESFYLGTPCFLAADAVERPPFANGILGGFSLERFEAFLMDFSSRRLTKTPLDEAGIQPARVCADVLIEKFS